MKWHLKASEKIGKKGSDGYQQTRREWAEKLYADGLHKDSKLILDLDDEPELFEDLAPYWGAYHVLSSSRNVGMGVGAIPLPAYESYFRIMRIDSLEEQFDYIRFVGLLDNEYLKWTSEQHEKESKKKSPQTPKQSSSKSQRTPARPPRR